MSFRIVFRNRRTGNTLEISPPDFLGASTISFNGRVVERILYSDISHTVPSRTAARSGRHDFARYLTAQLSSGAYRKVAQL